MSTGYTNSSALSKLYKLLLIVYPMKKSIVLILIILSIIIMVIAGIFIYNISSPPFKSCTQEAKICPDGKNIVGRNPQLNCEFNPCPNDSSKLNCPQGYIKERIPYPTPLGTGYYCKINKTWEDFDRCNYSTKCSDNLTCISLISDKQDFRCIPEDSFLISEGCSPSQGNTPQCWAV